ncbi:MAG: ABC transporter permease, partial [Planctomycetaceae bacterium]|nr:ABC transporter permease [Planctomycetaceae bacterium]
MRLQPFSVNINPLLLRELRQQVRNRFIIVLINLYVAVLVVVCLSNVLLPQNSSQIHGNGGILFVGLAVTMGIACFFTVVVYTALTTASERINGDLMFTSALKPSTIVFGKAFAGAILTMLLMSMTAPFVAVAYLLRGLDLEVVAVTFIGIFTTIQVLN